MGAPTLNWLQGVCFAALLVWNCCAASGPAADLILRHARIYTAAGGPEAEALAVRDGRLLFVGSNDGALQFRGPRTRMRDLGGIRVIPGLVDSHIHPVDILDPDGCDLHNEALSLAQITTRVRNCIRRYRVRPGEWLFVREWNPGGGNQPDEAHPTLRAALDAAAPRNPVELFGSEGHQAAHNSAALALARNASGVQVGLSARTLQDDFAALRPYVGITPDGEPDGRVTDDAIVLIDRTHLHYVGLEFALRSPERIAARLNSAGVTAVLDAEAAPEGVPVYDALLARHRMTFRANLAVFLDPEDYRQGPGDIDYERLLRDAEAMRAHFAGQALVRADFFKVFGDGEVEGDPFAHPPTPGNAALLHPYLQPVFIRDAYGRASVAGYVDPDPPWYGKLQHEPDVLRELIRRVHAAGFHVHVHVIGDRTARVVIDDIEAARAADGNAGTHDGLAHLQLADPQDVQRIGKDGLYVAFTFSWAAAFPDYDMTVAPFLQPVHGNAYEDVHASGSFYEENGYPARSVARAGGHLVAGSDAPVSTRDPQPFVNMAIAMTRRARGGMPYNERQGISMDEVLDAYTLEGARFLGRDSEIGSLEAGKSADFVLLDRDILALAREGRAQDVADTRVLETWFQGRRVYARH